jgi:hypothetical protein
VEITSGAAYLWGTQLSLPIRGRGEFRVAYLDRDLRIFEAMGSTAVQVRRSALAAGQQAAAGRRP